MENGDQETGAIGLWRRVGIPVFLAILCMFIAFALGASVQESPLSVTYHVPSGIKHFASDFFVNAALAIIVAMVVAEVVDRSARARARWEGDQFEQRAKAITEASTRAVAHNVWGADHSSAVLEETLETTFSSHLLREGFLHEVTFDSIPRNPRAVLVRQLTEYTVVNPSKSDEGYYPVFSFDDTEKIYPNDRSLVRPYFTNIRIGDTTFSSDKLNEINAELYATNGAEVSSLNPVSLGSYRIARDGRVRVRISSESIEPIDSQWISRVFVPTKGLCVVVHNNVGIDFVVFVLPLFRGDFTAPDFLDDGRTNWEQRFEGVILPHSGWVLRWNNTKIVTGPQ